MMESGITRHRYNIALVIFFAPYILFEIPSNVSLECFGDLLATSLIRIATRYCSRSSSLMFGYPLRPHRLQS